jgi:alpha-methylacyl-CoA racemase
VEGELNMAGPLDGLRVLELGGIGSAPFCGVVLADLGADVVRLERPGQAPLFPTGFDLYNRNKRSVLLDLKADGAVAAALRMVAAADVLIEGYRPGVAERLGLGPKPCLEANPKLVYGRMTGWGQDGPLAQLAGHDIDYLALTGALHCIGGAGQAPVPPLNLVADLGGGAMYLAVGLLAAVLESRRSGRGQVVDGAMVDGVVNLMSMFYAWRQLGQWTDRRGDNIVDGGAHFYGTYRTRDGKYVAVGAIEPQFYRELLDVLGLGAEALPAQNDRDAWPAMRRRFGAIFETRTRDEWVKAMEGRDACFAPILELDEAPAHPHLSARRCFQTFEGVLHPRPAPRFERTPGELRRPSPAPGQHDAEALADWGFGPDEIRRLRASGALRAEPAEPIPPTRRRTP